MNQYEEICKDMGQRAKAASFELAQIDQGTLDSALLAIADAVEAQTDEIMAANQLDLDKSGDYNVPQTMIDRLTLTPSRISQMAEGVRQDVYKRQLLTHEVVPDAGTVIVDDFDVTRMKRSKIPKLRRKLGVVFQDFRLLPNKTVSENIAFALEVIEEKPKVIKEKVSHVLELVGLTDKANDLPEDLSGGEQQRVAIARAIVNRPSVLIADEPTGNLDPDTSKGIVDLFKHINNFGTTVIMVTHNMDLVSYLNKRVIRLKDGRVQSDNMRGAEINEA